MFAYQCPAVVMAALLLCVGQGHATTLAPRALGPLSPSEAAQTLGDILRTDPLGYECVPEDRLDDAFQAGAKGARLPRTCLPEPCEEALDRDGLARVVGFQPDDKLWEDYFTRYAQYCRHEAVWPDEGIVAEGASTEPEITGAASFWRPLVTRGTGLATLRQGGRELFPGIGSTSFGTRSNGPTGGGFSVSSFSGGRGSGRLVASGAGRDATRGNSEAWSETDTNNRGTKSRKEGQNGADPGSDGTADQISFPEFSQEQSKPVPPHSPFEPDKDLQLTVVPLPASLVLLLAALGVLIPVNYRRRV